MEKFMGKYRSESARLQSWNYAWDGAYFITICTKGRESYFGEIVNEKMQLSPVGVIADILWYEIKNHAKNVQLDEFVVMPNHIHGIIILNGNNNIDTVPVDGEIGGSNDGEIDGKIDGKIDGEIVGTRHALSLQFHHQPHQPSQQLNNPPTEPLSPGQQRLRNQGKNTISSIVGSYKSAVTKHARRLGYEFAWQTRFYDHIIRNDDAFFRIALYIRNNPRKWNDDKLFGKE
jgi:putative transposase